MLLQQLLLKKPRRMETKSMGETAQMAKFDEGKNVGTSRRRQVIKQVGRTAEATRGVRRVHLARERSTERSLAAENRRIGKDEDTKVSDVLIDQG